MCPSGAVFTIPLGPTNPWLINIAKETLIFRRQGLSPYLRLLVPTFLLPHAPEWLTSSPSQLSGTLAYHYTRITLNATLERKDLREESKDNANCIFSFISSFCSLLFRVTCNVMRIQSSVSVICLAPIICGAKSLDEWAVTLSLNDGCF